ncbi:hypothetical protein AKJ09_06360 [Labilithrix luteola]|uniref:CBS domain-containing protein n=1 Tax=Labilithrix luteola TaxID=1391654 RepID=A0A0K1Q216_9BACT|nr:CBS domain-containing protein [Labilithrix luteola]AKU99696.1 hypothetical protein AKJ09_06360 [Labilithrix luteola]
MAVVVRDFMNPTLLYIHEGDRLTLARGPIVGWGIMAVAVLDESHRPVGLVSLHDLEQGSRRTPRQAGEAGAVETVRDTESLEVAARKAAEARHGNLHGHLVVVDEKGVALGIVTSVDILRAMLGMKPRHAPILPNEASDEEKRAGSPAVPL